MLPLQDINPRRRTPFITYGLIAINVVVFLWMLALSQDELQNLFVRLSVVPANITSDPLSVESLLDVLRSMFFHGGWLHLLGNMLYLYLFGDNVEDRMGAFLYLFVYFGSGIAAVIAQVMINPNSTVPLIGASGAIAGVLGAYLLLFPGVRVRGIIPLGFFSQLAEWPAWAVLGLWFLLQLFNGTLALSGSEAETGGGVAFFAHVGGFIFGIVITWLFMRMVPQPP
ncbi:MAG: rhomboid family intramembrane serine protease, partial [Candidatus Promineifilaceae bacterium]